MRNRKGARVRQVEIEEQKTEKEGTLQEAIEKVLNETGNREQKGKASLTFVMLIAVLIRALVSTNYYSGENDPPKFGDFECHRFWMETTHHFPPTQWYVNGPHMNTTYWPMDYPPLCAYAHWAMSQIVAVVTPQAIQLQSSFGYSSEHYRSLMRLALIVLEVVILIPAVIKLLDLLHPA